MFDSKIVTLWNQFCSKEVRSFTDALALAYDTEIAGFRSGITQMQFANTLALLNICDLPSCDTMSDIILSNKKMGAFEGLQRLGLKVDSSSSKNTVKKAFGCVYSALDHLLLPQHKKILGFNTIFVEHLLCKISRWEKMFPKKTFKTLRQMAETARKTGSWIVHDDHDERSFPFDLEISREQLKTWLEEVISDM
ncbi:hypothetical protein EV361DRAFT_793392 [Lentinula raphanica]|nr:hypothetical protein EV361DRAFT_793392 [Lentinula raphanica]